MAQAKDWHGDKAVEEQSNPVPPYSKYIAVRDFPGETPHDLPFSVGDVITVLEPCNVVYWYLGENTAGRRGVIPINFLKPCERRKPPGRQKSVAKQPPPVPPKEVQPIPPRPPKPTRPPVPAKATPTNGSCSPQLPHDNFQPSPKLSPPNNGSLRPCFPNPTPNQTSYTDIDSRPPAPLPPEASPTPKTPELIPQAKYHSQAEFMRKSGWFSPNLETVLCKKMGNAQLSAISNTAGVYYFLNREYTGTAYTAKSKNAFHELVQMFHQLYDKPHDKLSTLEYELRYNHPDAKGWMIRLLTVSDCKTLPFHETWFIVNHRTLQPDGLNSKLTFQSKEHFYEFAEEYAKKIRDKK